MDHIKYLLLSKEYIDGSLKHMRTDQDDRVGFLEGNAGVYAVASVIYDSIGWSQQSQDFLANVVQIVGRRPLTNQVDNNRGLTGLLYTIEFLESYYGKQLFDRS